jgi:hypothetical protein
MAQRRVFLDANVIIEAFRISVWPELSKGCWLETVEECERESLTGGITSPRSVQVDAKALSLGLRQSHPVSKKERTALSQAHPSCRDMDPGEKDLFAHLFVNHNPLPPLIVVNSGDKGVFVRAKDLGWLDNLVSLEELLVGCKVSKAKLNALDRPHTARFLSEKRTEVMLGIIP